MVILYGDHYGVGSSDDELSALAPVGKILVNGHLMTQQNFKSSFHDPYEWN